MLLELFQAVTGIFVVVYDGQHALKFRLGRARNVVGPGLHFKLPIIERYQLEGTKHTTLDLEPQVIQLKDDLVYEVDCKVMYQIVDLRKAVIQIDDLVTGMQNIVVMAVQRTVQRQDRHTVRDTAAMSATIREELRPMEENWGIKILQVGFSNISPSPASLEITQLDLLARERLEQYHRFRAEGLAPAATVALVTGAVIATSDGNEGHSLGDRRREDVATRALMEARAADARQDEKQRAAEASEAKEDPLADAEQDGEDEDE